MSRPPLRLLSGATAAAAVLGALLITPATATAAPVTAAPATAAAPAAAAPAPAAPRVGDCRATTSREGAAATDPDAPISCSRPHTARTIKVVPVSAKVAGNPTLAFPVGIRACSSALAKELGKTPAARVLTAYSFVFFTPTQAQVRQGARWIRCDLVLFGGTAFVPLPTDKTPALSPGRPGDKVARCLQVGRSVSLTTVCARKHNFRARGAVRAAGQAYPGNRALSNIAQRRCQQIAGRGWYATWPSKDGWRLSGQRHVVCYAATRR